jgi:hypothetical protein
MPEIQELLHDAVPTIRPLDEDALRRRVVARRRRRRLAAMTATAAVVAVMGAAVWTLDDRPAGRVVAEAPDEPATGVAVVGADVWIGGDGFVARTDGTARVDVPGAVRALSPGDLLWASGDDWVAAIDPATATVNGMWTGGAVAELQPLAGRRVAVTQPAGSTVVVLEGGASGVVEVARIAVDGEPTDVVLTLGGELWVRAGRTLTQLDPTTGSTVGAPIQWAGPLLAPSASGGIWTMDGVGIVDLHPDAPPPCVSCETGSLQPTATLAVETPDGLYVGGPEGLSRHDVAAGFGEVVDADPIDDLAAGDGQVVYLVGGEVRTAPSPDANVGQADPTLVAASFLAEELGWPDDVQLDYRDTPYPNVIAYSPSLDRDAEVSLERRGGEWHVFVLQTRLDHHDPASLSLGRGNDHVRLEFSEPGLTPQLTVRFGDVETVRTGEPGAVADFRGDLGFVPNVDGWVQVLWLDANGVALEGWANALREPPTAGS